MQITKKGVFGFAAVCCLVFLAVIGICYYLVKRSHPQTTGSVTVQGLEAKVTVSRDEYGVPHISGGSERDVFFAAGFIHAQDRLWQMDFVRRIGTGRLAEILGEPAVKTDKMFRTLGLWKQANKNITSIDAETRNALQAYADGVNQFIATQKGSYPIEFDMLQYEPEPWQVEHSLLIGKLMAWELNYSRWIDLLLAELVQRFGEERAREIFPYWQDNAPLIIPAELKGKKITENLRPWFDAEKEYRALTGTQALESGSNAWAIAGSRSVTGKPILANDPHLILMLPARWYEFHLTAPAFDAAGMSFPGIPFIIAGRNRHIAWGVTNAMIDDSDYYLEEVDSLQHPTQYQLNNEWRPVTEEIDTIIVKGSLPIAFSMYSTHRGPIINKMEPTAQAIRSLISMRWTGYELSNEIGAFYRIDKASNWQEFGDALKLFSAPAQNFVYADIEGNIGYRTGGLIPLRKVKGPTLPYPGLTDEYDWKGFVPFDHMPQLLNPAGGYIVTANNKIIDDSYPYHISNHWELPWRSKRIIEVLNEQEKFSMEDMQRLQNDRHSVYAREFVPYILHAYDSVRVTDRNVQTMLEYYRTWTCEMRIEDVSTTLFQATVTKLVYNTFHDKMGDRLYGLYDTLASTPLSVLSHLMNDPESRWFDDWKTDTQETRDMCIRRSVDDAMNELKGLLGGELKEWQWGRVHTVSFDHVFGTNALLASFMNVGPYAAGGSHTTVNVGQYFLAHPYKNAVGPSMRQLCNLADINDTRTVFPPGQSGQVFSRHYKDQVMLWLNGGYKVRPMQPGVIESTCDEVLILKPDK